MMCSIHRKYKSALDELRTSKIEDDIHREQSITILTLIAHQEMRGSKTVVDAIRDHWERVSYPSRILVINLIHSIVTTVGGEYKHLFNKYIVEMFVSAFKHNDQDSRTRLFRWRKTWDQHFSKENLHKLDCAVKKIYQRWPIEMTTPEDIQKRKNAAINMAVGLKRNRMANVNESIVENPPKKQKMEQVHKSKLKPESAPALKHKIKPEVQKSSKSTSRPDEKSNMKPKVGEYRKQNATFELKPKSPKTFKISPITPGTDKESNNSTFERKTTTVPLKRAPLKTKKEPSNEKQYLQLFGDDDGPKQESKSKSKERKTSGKVKTELRKNESDTSRKSKKDRISSKAISSEEKHLKQRKHKSSESCDNYLNTEKMGVITPPGEKTITGSFEEAPCATQESSHMKKKSFVLFGGEDLDEKVHESKLKPEAAPAFNRKINQEVEQKSKSISKPEEKSKMKPKAGENRKMNATFELKPKLPKKLKISPITSGSMLAKVPNTSTHEKMTTTAPVDSVPLKTTEKPSLEKTYLLLFGDDDESNSDAAPKRESRSKPKERKEFREVKTELPKKESDEEKHLKQTKCKVSESSDNVLNTEKMGVITPPPEENITRNPFEEALCGTQKSSNLKKKVFAIVRR